MRKWPKRHWFRLSFVASSAIPQNSEGVFFNFLQQILPPPEYLQLSTNINSFVKVTFPFNPNASLHPNEKRQRPYRNTGSAPDPMRHVLNGVSGVPGLL